MWVCDGFNRIDTIGTSEDYQVIIDRSGADQKSGIPVQVTILHKVNMNTAKPSMFKQLMQVEGRYHGNDSKFNVMFNTSDSLDAAVGNSGITGITHRMQGTLKLDNKSIVVSCPQNI